jgi:hypothetical protein
VAQASVIGGHAAALVKRVLPLRAAVGAGYSAVMGVAPPGQLRRGFAAYLENALTAAILRVGIGDSVANGKIAEHWDVMQEEVPAAQSANGNSMFIGS